MYRRRSRTGSGSDRSSGNDAAMSACSATQRPSDPATQPVRDNAGEKVRRHLIVVLSIARLARPAEPTVAQQEPGISDDAPLADVQGFGYFVQRSRFGTQQQEA